MAGKRKPNSPLLCAPLCAMLLAASALGQTVRHHQEKVETDTASAAVTQAETAIEKQDFATAEKLLLPVVAANPKDATAWYDLGSVYRAKDRDEEALEAFRKAVALKPDSFDINRRLGMLLVIMDKKLEAVPYLRTAIRTVPPELKQIKPSLWSVLGQALEQENPAEAVVAFRHVTEIDPKQGGAHLSAARVLARLKDFRAAAEEYKAELALDPQSKQSLLGLAEVYRDSGHPKDSAAIWEQYTKQFPDDSKVQFMFGEYLVSAGDPKGALSHFEAALKQSPRNQALRHDVAAMYAAKGDYATAAPQYEELMTIAPENGHYHYEYGVVLMQLHRFPEAQEQLVAALQRDGSIKDAYDQLALAASENKQYPLTIQVLDARGKLTSETPATLFLRATAYDNLKAFPQAVENYHKFLEASNGQFPDNEWKAKHRLIAIEPFAGTKKK